MADLKSLIRLHKYKLDEMQRAMAELNAQVAALEKKKADLLDQIRREQEAGDKNPEMALTYGAYAQAAIERRRNLDAGIELVEAEILKARDRIRDAFAELKKYEMTQEAREQAEQDEIDYKESLALDEMGLETHRRKEKE